MAIEWLAPEDEIMLWADERWPQDIGALAILDGSRLFDAGGRFRLEAMQSAAAARLHLLPHFRQLLYVPPPELGGPLWVDAPAFDIRQHVHVLPVPAPGSEAELLHIAEQLVSQGLDRSRPLWEMWFLTGLAEGRVAWLVKLHHCIADGIAGVATFGTFLDAALDVVAASPVPWTPAPAPLESDLLADSRQRRRIERGRWLSSLEHPVFTAREFAAAWPALRELLGEPSLPPTSLSRTVGGTRQLALIRSRLEVVKAIAHRSNAKVNDVLLAAIAGGLGELLRHRGEPANGTVLRVYVPVTLRPVAARAQARGNQIAQMVVPVPIGKLEPAERLRKIAVETAERKARLRPSIGKLPHHGFTGRAMLKLIDRQRVNVTTADLPGPPVPLFLAGAQVLEVFPLLPLIGKVPLGIGALSYAGQFNITVVADAEACPDLEVLVNGLGKELRALAKSIGVDAQPEVVTSRVSASSPRGGAR